MGWWLRNICPPTFRGYGSKPPRVGQREMSTKEQDRRHLFLRACGKHLRSFFFLSPSVVLGKENGKAMSINRCKFGTATCSFFQVALPTMQSVYGMGWVDKASIGNQTVFSCFPSEPLPVRDGFYSGRHLSKRRRGCAKRMGRADGEHEAFS